MFIGYYNLANFVTLTGMLSSLTAMFAAYQHDFKTAALMLIFAGICDALDGRLARNRRQEPDDKLKLFGIMMDSLCDLISFAVAPAFVAYCFGCRSVADIVIYFFFISCGIIRLAFYNTRVIVSDGRAKDFVGVPITASVAFIPAFITLAMFVDPVTICYIFRVFFVVMGAAYIAKIKVPRPSMKLILTVIAVSALCIAIMYGLRDIAVKYISVL